MITCAAVKIVDFRQGGKEVLIPCHRHGDAFYIIYQFGYHKGTDHDAGDYKTTTADQGFLDEHGNFYNRIEAFKHAQQCGQIDKNLPVTELYSEDLW